MNRDDVILAAGWYEGEGSTHFGTHGSLTVQICQKDLWMLQQLHENFGGFFRIYPKISTWCVYGWVALAFILLIYPFLSPRRKGQIKKAVTLYLENYKPHTHCRRGHEYTKANTGKHSSGHRFCKECDRIVSSLYYYEVIKKRKNPGLING